MSRLSDYFRAAASKTLARVETDPAASNQHEFNGVNGLRRILGDNPEPTRRPCVFIYLGENEEETLIDEGFVTWYDARRNAPHRSAEFRLYFQATSVMEQAREGDQLVIAQLNDGSLVAIVARAGTTSYRQLRYVFGIQSSNPEFELDEGLDDREVDFVRTELLEALGVPVVDRADAFLDTMLTRFEGGLPTTFEFSRFARETCQASVSTDEPDRALVTWIDWEYKLFRTMERHLVERRIGDGFVDAEGGVDVDAFLSFSLSVQNRRKSRVGYALENHLVAIFDSRDIRYERGCVTESPSKPDFIFPSCRAYHDPDFPAERLAMLGAKSTCKDRWRQVLCEAGRIETKHLLTLEGGISASQTSEMQRNNLQLVVPQSLHQTFDGNQRVWLMSVADFIDMLRGMQR